MVERNLTTMKGKVASFASLGDKVKSMRGISSELPNRAIVELGVLLFAFSSSSSSFSFFSFLSVSCSSALRFFCFGC